MMRSLCQCQCYSEITVRGQGTSATLPCLQYWGVIVLRHWSARHQTYSRSVVILSCGRAAIWLWLATRRQYLVLSAFGISWLPRRFSIRGSAVSYIVSISISFASECVNVQCRFHGFCNKHLNAFIFSANSKAYGFCSKIKASFVANGSILLEVLHLLRDGWG